MQTSNGKSGKSFCAVRWANERLRQLLLQDASREEVAELGTRYGLITPFTPSFSAASTIVCQTLAKGADPGE